MLNIFKGIHTGPLSPLTDHECDLRDRLAKHVDMLAGVIGPRNALEWNDQLEAAAKYLEMVLRDLGYTTGSQPYELRNGRIVRNIDAQIDGAAVADEIVLVGAHYDSVAFGACPGANDNASGVAATLELARALVTGKPRRSIRFVAFVNEEPPYFQTKYMGSLVYAKRCRERNENIVAMITPETIGCYFDEKGTQSFPVPLNVVYPTIGNFIAFVGNAASRDLVRRVTDHFRNTTQFPAIGFAAPMWITKAGWSDHWSFWKCGYPGLMATDTAPLRYRHYHTPQDTPEKLDYERMARVVAGLERVIANEANRA